MKIETEMSLCFTIAYFVVIVLFIILIISTHKK